MGPTAALGAALGRGWWLPGHGRAGNRGTGATRATPGWRELQFRSGVPVAAAAPSRLVWVPRVRLKGTSLPEGLGHPCHPPEGLGHPCHLRRGWDMAVTPRGAGDISVTPRGVGDIPVTLPAPCPVGLRSHSRGGPQDRRSLSRAAPGAVPEQWPCPRRVWVPWGRRGGSMSLALHLPPRELRGPEGPRWGRGDLEASGAAASRGGEGPVLQDASREWGHPGTVPGGLGQSGAVVRV